MAKNFGTKRNIIANIIGKVWVGMMSFVFLPVYINLLGIEAYGLISVFVSLAALIAILDMGLSTTINRELARLTTMKDTEQEARDLVRTMETIYWALGLAIAAGVIAAAPWIARHWVHASKLSPAVVTQAIMIMGLILAFQWPDSFYTGGLMGLQRQVTVNYIRGVIATVQGVGAVLILKFVAPSISAYFLWQIIICAVQTFTLLAFLWAMLPKAPRRPCYRQEILRANWKFTSGITGISLLAVLFTQLDKIVLSKLLTLEMFGYYGLAVTMANLLAYIVNPVFSAVFPKFSQLVVENQVVELATLYHKSCQLLSLILIPIWIIGALFSPELILLYTHNVKTVSNVHLLFSLILTGTALNSLMMMPYALQLAYGWTKLSLYQNALATLLFVPIMFWMIRHYGTSGAAIVWIMVNASYFPIMIPIMHTRLLRGEMSRWYMTDIGRPLVVSVTIGLFARFFMPRGAPLICILLYILATAAAAFIASAFATPLVLNRLYLKGNISV